MEAENHTALSHFLLLGLSEDPDLQSTLFRLFLSMYLVTVFGNLLIILASHHEPLALCPPGSDVLAGLIMFWITLIRILLAKRLTFSTGTEIPHFFCELAQLLKVAVSDALINNIFTYVAGALLVVFPMTEILFSYSQIVSSLMRMSSIESKDKAFSTSGSHLCVIFLFYGTGVGVYLSSSVTHSFQASSVASVMYTVVTPMLNPFIYSLRNTDVKGALRILLSRTASCLCGITEF
ncbi:Hypothetical predicted protein [Marmota monax]|uniref:G-protein coupled receptors family 1 profile domain-containing protein n=1 Tax=Marmota monax TaxID=9995 RepID=A0A5E4D5R9_MARMO|nr:Hypothetical predicted protein [Marmota monax]